MKKIRNTIIISLLVISAHAQNVGIGTTAPDAKLHINSRSSSVNPSLLITDSTNSSSGRLVLQNTTNPTKTMSLLGYSFSNLSSDSYLDINSDATNIVTFRGNGTVGIGNSSPTNKLDVNGDVNITGTLKINNSAGTAGQILRSNGTSAAPSWGNPSSCFTKMQVYNSFALDAHTAHSFTVPPGITTIYVELWGAGAGGSLTGWPRSGGGGGYAATYATVTPGQTLNLSVAGASGAETNGLNSFINLPGLSTTSAEGGTAPSATAAGFGGYSSSSFNPNQISMKGEDGTIKRTTYEYNPSYTTDTYLKNEYGGKGGDGANTKNTGGSGGVTITNYVGGVPTVVIFENVTFPKAPGGGGPVDFNGGRLGGAPGRVIIHY